MFGRGRGERPPDIQDDYFTDRPHSNASRNAYLREVTQTSKSISAFQTTWISSPNDLCAIVSNNTSI
jgi:hypothetical protein